MSHDVRIVAAQGLITLLKTKMKIAFLSDGAYEYAAGISTAVGGAERDQWLLASALVVAGSSVTVGVRRHLKTGDRKVIDGVEYVGIGQGQILWAWQKFLFAERPNWLFWECSYHLWGLLVEIAKLAKVRTIFHAAYDTDVEPRKALTWRQRWWPLYAWGLSRTDRIFVQHKGQLSKLPSRLQSKAYVLPKVCILPGVIGDEVAIKTHAMRDNYVAWVGMLREHKRPDLLVEIARKVPDIRFVVCGGPSTYMTPPGYSEKVINDLRALPNVEYLGQVPPDRAQQVIANAAILLSTSDEEGFPNTFVQAWSSGTPIVTLKVDPDCIIKRICLGAVSGNMERAIGDITVLLDSPQRRDEIATRARTFVVENHSAATVVSLFERALQGLS